MNTVVGEGHFRTLPVDHQPAVVTRQSVTVVAPALVEQRPSTDTCKQTAPERTVRQYHRVTDRPSFDFHFVNSDQQVRSILHSLTQDASGDVVLIHHPEQLLQDDLVQCLHISADGQYRQKPGRLFISDLTLVLDIRALSGDELPTFNDLLDPDQPSLFDKLTGVRRALGSHVRVLVLAQLVQLQTEASGIKAPGADFWRRVNRPGNCWQPPEQSNRPDSLLAEYPNNTINSVTINCHMHASWRRLLFGGPGIDDNGRISHIPGQLAQVEHGQHVILKGANWQDLSFEQAIRQLITRRQYQENGEPQRLADNVTFYRMPVASDELSQLWRATVSNIADQASGQNHILINQANIAQWLNPFGISPEGVAITNNILSEQIRAGATLSVTSPLSEVLWFQLLGAVERSKDCTGRSPQKLTAISAGQPQSLEAELAKTGFIAPPLTFKMVTFRQEAEANAWLDAWDEKPLIIQISPLTTFSQLFDKLHIISEQKVQFGRQRTGLQQALAEGKPVVLRGLDSNPALQQALEPLLCDQPLPLNGTLSTYPDANLTVLWPALAKSASPLLTAAQALPCPELDIWTHCAAQHGMTRPQLPEQAINKLYEASRTIPSSLCPPLPTLSEELLGSLIRVARQAQKHDSSLTLQAHHWRRAIDSVLTHGTRTHSGARDYMKVTCQQLLPESQDWVDPGRLQQVLGSAPKLHRQFVVKHLWSLARCFGPGVLRHCGLHLLPFSPPNLLDSEVLDTFCTLIVTHCAPALQRAIAEQLEVETDQSLQLQLNIRPSAQIRRLQDALAGGWRMKAQHNHAQALAMLAAQCFVIARAAADNAVTLISERLTRALTWQGSAAPPLLTLADDLYHSRTNQADSLARRLSRLHQRLAHVPVIFLQGETGTGKSYFAATVAKTSGPAFIASLGPYDSEQTLAKRWYWQENDNDRGMKEQNQVLMTWANTNGTDNDHYVTLVLDEGNLAADGLLSALTGLWEPTPCVYVNGHPVIVSTKHRVIITGNPDNYLDRQTEPTLKGKIPCIHYPHLKREFLEELVIKPALGQFILDNQSIAATADAILALWQHYPQLLPNRLFTPRDLQDICAWAGWYLKQTSTTEPTREQLHGMVLQCFRDLLNPQITATDRANALESWFSACYATDFALVKQTHDRILAPACRAFITLASDVKPEFDTSPEAVIELVLQLSQDLHRCQQSFHHHRPHGGRQATIIEGPPGRGKDVTLQLLLQSVEQQVIARGETMPAVHCLNACDCAWDDLRNIIKQARMQRSIVVVAELNMIDSQYLEGELNDTLTGDAHPGFHLFATVNPCHYGGRKPLSPALTARFRHLPIRAYHLNELQAIASKAMPANKHAQAAILACWHCRVRRALHDKNLPLLPTSLDLQKAATAINNGGDFSQSTLEQTFKQHYQLYLLALRTTLEQLPELPVATTASTIDTALCDWLHRVLPQMGPWLIKRHGRNQLLEQQRTICVKFSLNVHEAQQTIITVLAQAQWRAANLPLTPTPTEPGLIQAFYRLWQQRWFMHHFQHTDIAPETVFPITTAQRELLATANQQHLEQITTLVNDFGQYSSYHWLTVKKSLNQWSADDLPTASNNDYVDVYIPESGQETDLPPAMANTYPLSTRLLTTTSNLLLAPVTWTYKLAQQFAHTIHNYWRPPSSAQLVDRRTDYEEQPIEQWLLTQHFNSHHLPSQYRLKCQDISVRSDGEIIVRDYPARDVEVDMPAKVPGRQQVVGKISLIPVDGLCLLPGLTADEDIVEMQTVPPVQYRLSRDQYSGLHRVRVPASNQRVTFTYMVQAREGPDQNPSQPLDVHCSQPMKLAIETLFAHMDEYSQHQREQLLAIAEATTTEQRIDAITHYCQQFSGRTKPRSDQHLFLYLLQQQQGSCCHRAVVFVALCRYFAIAARIICNTCHVFVEFSLNQTWQSRDLGGAPGPAQIVVPDFSPSYERAPLARPEAGPSDDYRQPNQSGLSAQAEMLISVFDHASNEEQACLAKAINVSTDSLHQGTCTSIRLAGANSPTAMVIESLWGQGSLAGLSLGLTLLKGRYLLDDMNKRLISFMLFDTFPEEALFGTLQKLLSSDVDTDQFMQLLADIYTAIIISNDNVRPVRWHDLLVDALSTSDLTKPAAAILTHEAFASGWIALEHKSPLATKTFPVNAKRLFKLLKKLGQHEEFKVLSDDYLKRWYHHFLRPQGIQCTECQSSCWEDQEANTLISHSLSGHSLQLDSWLTTSTLQSAWSDEPEGIPDIARLLARLPAYRRTFLAQNLGRSVIIISNPLWCYAGIEYMADILLHKKLQSDPKLSSMASGLRMYDFLIKEMNTKINKIKENGGKKSEYYQTRVKEEYAKKTKPFAAAKEQSKELMNTALRLLMQQFCQYFFQKTTTKGNQLHFCWFDGHTDNHSIGFGSHQPSSPEELFAMFTHINHQDFHRLDLDHKLLNQVLNTSNGLVLDACDISTIVQEYLSSADLDLICNHWQV